MFLLTSTIRFKMKYGLNIILILVSFFVFGQKLKPTVCSVKYVRPPKLEQKINKVYTWRVKELTRDQNMRVLEKNYAAKEANYGRGQFFAAYTELGSIPGFQPPIAGLRMDADQKINPSCFLKVDIGIADIMDIKPNRNGKVNPNNTDSPVALVYDVWVSVPLTFDFRYAQNGPYDGEFFEHPLKNVHFDSLYYRKEEKFTRKFRFPSHLKALSKTKGFSTNAELDLKFTKHKQQFIKECKDRLIAAFLKESKLEIESNYCYAKRQLPLRFYAAKDKEDTYAELANYASMLKKEVEPLLAANIEANNKMNWYSTDIKAYVNQLAQFHEKFLDREDLTYTAQSAADYNLIWLYFMQSNFNAALGQIEKLENRQEKLKNELKQSKKLPKEQKKDYKTTIDAVGYFDLEIIRALILDYRPRYEKHWEELNWN